LSLQCALYPCARRRAVREGWQSLSATRRESDLESAVRHWFILSAVGRDRPGIVADLAQLVYDCEANLEDSRMTLLGNEFAAIFLCSGSSDDLQQRLSDGARRLEWENRLTVFLRPLEGQPRPPVPAAGSRLARVAAEGEDRAGIVARICRLLADLSINIADLRSETQPSPSGSAIYRMSLLVEVPDSVKAADFSSALDEVGREIGVEVRVEPAE
jgi:glycine cleavage system transcriptional repressor